MSLTDVNLSGLRLNDDLLKEFVQRREAMDTLEQAFKDAEKAYRVTEEQLFEQMEAMGVKSLRVDGLGTLTRTLKGPYVSIDDTIPDALEAFKQWCHDNGYYDMIFRFAPQMAAVNPIVKKMREKGEPTPPGTKVTEHRRIQVLRK